jgi:Glycosyltransferase
MKKALFVASVFSFFVFEKKDIKILQDKGYVVFCAANCSKNLGEFGDTGKLNNLHVTKCQIDFSRSPFSRLNIIAYKQLKKLLSDNDFQVIHCHTPVAGILTRLAARKARKNGTKVIYTAHGFHFYKGAPLINWLIYYPIEKWLSKYTDVLITINKEDFAKAKKSFQAMKIIYIPGVGIDIERFYNLNIDISVKRQELMVPNDAYVILSIGELSKRKNHETAIKAIAKLKNLNIFYIICGEGPLENYLSKLIIKLELQEKVKLLGFRHDINEICQSADIFVFPSIQEGLPVSVMEAMAVGLPCVATNIRGTSDLIKNKKGGFLCGPKDILGFTESIYKLVKDPKLKKEMGLYNQKIVKSFEVEIIKNLMEDIYNEVLNESKI